LTIVILRAPSLAHLIKLVLGLSDENDR
jgi:hypothetical protein